MTYEEQQRLLKVNLERRKNLEETIISLNETIDKFKLILEWTYSYERELNEKKFDLKTGEEITNDWECI